MITKIFTVSNKLGIHARPAGMIVDITGQARSDVSIVFDGSRANAKSILNGSQTDCFQIATESVTVKTR